MSIEEAVNASYAGAGVGERVLAALADPDAPTVDQLAPYDELHSEGRGATERLVARLDLGPDDRVLDAGCGIGGPARLLAHLRGCSVIGVDLNPDYVAAAAELTRRVGLADLVRHEVGNICSLRFDDGTFSAATLFHVNMNIADKRVLFAELARVVRSGGHLGVWEVTGDTTKLTFPVPWSATPETSFVVPADELLGAAEDAGWDIEFRRDGTAESLAFFSAQRAAREEGRATGPGPGIAIPDFPTRVANFAAGLASGAATTTEAVLRRR